MSADVDMLPRQWDNEKKNHFDETSVNSNQMWERNLIMKSMHQHKNGLLADESGEISEASSHKSVFERGSMVSYFYPAMENTNKSTSRIKKNKPKPNVISQESKRANDVEESILPVHQNPILLQDLERRSKDLTPPRFKFSNWKNSTEEASAFPADTGEDFVFEDSSKCKEDGDSEEVAYGRGFVHRLLLKFSNLAHQDEPPKHKTSPKVKFGSLYDSEPSLTSKSEPKMRIKSPDRTLETDVGDKSLSDGEEKIEPVLNTLCMFEKLFCSRKKSQEEQGGTDGGYKPNISPTIPTLRKFTPKPSVPTKSIYVSKCKLTNTVNDNKNHSATKRADNPIACNAVKETKKTKRDDKKVEISRPTETKDSNAAENGKMSSPVDVKLVKTLFEPASVMDQIVKIDISKGIGPGKCSSGSAPQNVSIASSEIISTTAVVDATNVSTSIVVNNNIVASAKSEDLHQHKQHKRHSSRDYLEITQSDKISDDYKEAMSSKKNDKKTQNSSVQTKSIATVARPGKLLIRSSNATSSVDVMTLPKYNDIRTGEFVPASKSYVDDQADDIDDEDVDFQFEGAGVDLDRSMLAKTKDTRKLRILFDDSTTTTHEYPSEQSLIDWFNDHASSATVISDVMFLI